MENPVHSEQYAKFANSPPIYAQRRILIAAGEPLMRNSIAQALQEEYELLLAPSGDKALNILGQPEVSKGAIASIDLLILDEILNWPAPLDICQFLRERGSDIPILILGSESEAMNCSVALDAGADDYLPKPFSNKELIVRCRTLLRRYIDFKILRTPEPVIKIREIELYPASRRVLVKGRDVSLTLKEFNLLELLMRHPNQIWSKQELLDSIWGKDHTGSKKTLDVHLRWLREKIEVDPSHPAYLITQKGAGYYFDSSLNTAA